MFAKLIFLVVVIKIVHGQEESVKRCARAAGACLLAPETTEGPYYWNSTVRQDITENKPGIPLRLSITVLDTSSCSPIADALVDLWHCDSVGVYSHFLAASQGQMRGRNDNSTFFRGQQVTNAQGIATFATVYPGWYPGRATHMHIKVHIGASLTNIGGAIYAKGGHVSHTGQFFFDDALNDRVATTSPYSTHTVRRVRNNEDGIYEDSNGATMIVPIKLLGSDFKQGMTGEITVGVNPTAIPQSTGFGGGPRPNGSRPPRPPPTKF